MARQGTQVIETRLGEREVRLDKVLTFPRGLIGFERIHEFILLQLEEDSPFLMLQAFQQPTVGLLVADPFSFTTDYDVKLTQAEKALIQLENLADAAILVTVSIPPGQPERTALNLMGPICVNNASQLGVQAPQVDAAYPSKVYIQDLFAQDAQSEQKAPGTQPDGDAPDTPDAP